MSVLKKLRMERQFLGMFNCVDEFLNGSLKAMSFDKFLNGIEMEKRFVEELEANRGDYIENVDGDCVYTIEVMKELQLLSKMSIGLDKFIKYWERL